MHPSLTIHKHAPPRTADSLVILPTTAVVSLVLILSRALCDAAPLFWVVPAMTEKIPDVVENVSRSFRQLCCVAERVRCVSGGVLQGVVGVAEQLQCVAGNVLRVVAGHDCVMN